MLQKGWNELISACGSLQGTTWDNVYEQVNVCTSFMYKIYIQLSFTYTINNLSNIKCWSGYCILNIFFLSFLLVVDKTFTTAIDTTVRTTCRKVFFNKSVDHVSFRPACDSAQWRGLRLFCHMTVAPLTSSTDVTSLLFCEHAHWWTSRKPLRSWRTCRECFVHVS